jgi:AAA domain
VGPHESGGKQSGAWREDAITAPNLAAKALDPAPFVLPGFIPAGMAILAGRPRAGKSSLALDVALAVAGGCCTLGTLQPAHGAALYLALEESEHRLKQRVERLLTSVRAPSAERLTLVTRWRRLEEGGLGDLAEWCRAVADPRLIVIDTLAKVQRPGKARPEEIDGATVAGLRGLATMHGLAVLAIHHTPRRKADDVLDGIGLGNAADTTLVLSRSGAGAVLHVRGHDIEASETAVQLDKATGRWTLLGPAADVRRSHERAQILDVLAAAGGEALPVRDIMVRAEIHNRNAADILLCRMLAAGDIARAARGRYTLTKDAGKIGQKETNDIHPADATAELGNLSDLSDLCAGGDMRGAAGDV